MKILPALLCALLLAAGGCAGLRPDASAPEQNAAPAAQERLDAFMAKRATPGPAALEGSLRFGTTGDTRRVTWLIWGNNADALRFDVQAGMGTLLAAAALKDGRLSLYLPDENRLIQGEDAPDGLLRRAGLDMPLSLKELYSVIQGDFSALLPNPRIYSAETLDEGGIRLTLRSDSPQMPALTLELDARNLPVRWTIPASWDVELRNGPDGLPDKLDAVKKDRMSGETYRVVLLIKNRTEKEAFSERELSLQVPADARMSSAARSTEAAPTAFQTRALAR